MDSQQTLKLGGQASAAVPVRPRIGRYAIEEQLGAGAMGVVWAARDPELDRRVAIKVIHQTRNASERLGERLRREAQALARVSHANVVTVFDAGLDVDGLYVVMQLIEGVTLDRYLAETHATPAQIFALFSQAGWGLAAAHAAGIVHRDFKPHNVLVDRHGAVRVTDFGLARADAIGEPTEPGDPTLSDGQILGTPAYMAPEQFAMSEVTPAADQFAFCVALWEALCGERPFAGGDLASIRAEVTAGRLREPKVKLAGRVRAALTRGLATDPKDRFGSISELLAALIPRRRRAWLGAGAFAAVIAIGATAFVMTRPPSDPCAGIAAPIDVVWDAPHRAAVRAALGDGADGVLRQLDDRAGRWRAAMLDSCLATRVRATQPVAILERRERCLDRSLLGLRAAVDVLSGPLDAGVRARAVDVARSGIDPEACAATGPGVTAGGPAYRLVAAAAVDNDAGRGAAVLARRDRETPLIAAAKDAELAAEWDWQLGRALELSGDSDATRDAFRRSAREASEAGRDDLATRAWAQLAMLMAKHGDLHGADDLLAVAGGAAKRGGGPHAQIAIDQALSSIELDRGNFKPAVDAAKRALDATLALDGGDGVAAGIAYGVLLDAQLAADDLAGALAAGTHARDILTRALGADHPATLEVIQHLAAVVEARGDVAAARPLWDTALAGTTRSFGATSTRVMRVLLDRAIAETPGGMTSTPEALAAIEQATAIGEAALPPKDPQRAQLYETLAMVQSTLHHDADALATYRRAIAFYETLDDPLGLARVVYDYGDTLKAGKNCTDAIPQFRRAAKLAASTGQRSRLEAVSLGAVGACLGTAGRYAEAQPALEQAIAALDELGDVPFAAQNRWELADQLHKRGDPKWRAIAQHAADELAGRPPPAEQLRAQIVDWIANPK